MRILLLCALIVLWACAGQPSRPPQIEAVSDNAGVTVSTDSSPDEVVIAIHDPAGIGNAQFSLTGGEFPRRLVYRLYLKGLEQLQLAYSGTLVTASLSSQPGNQLSQQVELGSGTPVGQAVEQGEAYWMEVEIVPQDEAQATIPLEQGYFQVEPPPDFYKQKPETWSLSWVDFYR